MKQEERQSWGEKGQAPLLTQFTICLNLLPIFLLLLLVALLVCHCAFWQGHLQANNGNKCNLYLAHPVSVYFVVYNVSTPAIVKPV